MLYEVISLDKKEQIKKNISRFNPFAIRRRNAMRRSLVNKTPSFLCPNCIGGILFHDLGLQFRSPTVNLMMAQREFARFVLDLDHYLELEPVFFQKDGYTCPCARLGDITIHFTHYATEAEALEKWNQRKARIDRDNLFVFLTERDGLTREEILRLGDLNCRGLVVFTAKPYPDIPYTVYLPQYGADGEVGNILKKNHFDESREYECCFDFVKWFNEADGAPYDLSRFIK